jgi:hypothetical protein
MLVLYTYFNAGAAQIPLYRTRSGFLLYPSYYARISRLSIARVKKMAQNFSLIAENRKAE